MTLKEQILDAITLVQGLTDTDLENRLGKSHQAVNRACRELASSGKLIRKHDPIKGVIVNYLSQETKPAAASHALSYVVEPVSPSDTYGRIVELMEKIEALSDCLGAPITKDDYYIEDLGCPHQPGSLPKGYAGVYFFEYRGQMLKIGKANAKSNARFESQHYGFAAPSTLAKSICGDSEFKALGISPENAGIWIRNNLRRYNVLIKARDDKAGTELIEAVMHYAFRPKYEGAIK